MIASIPISLYIHIPWCVRKCPYCDFSSQAIGDQRAPERPYIDALLADLEQELPLIWGRRVQTLFIGGGTPSLFSPEAIDRLLSGIRARVPLNPRAEITVEANPGTVDRAQLAELRAVGVNRLSIGVQSFDNDLLHRIGRIHDCQAAITAVESTHAVGLACNIDLMYGLPGQTLHTAQSDVAQALALGPAHLSYYQLTVEPHTAFGAHPPVLPKEAQIDRMQRAGQAMMAAQGYVRYEISAYAQPGAQCQHNLNYWMFGDYVGIGAGAHGKRTDMAIGSITRTWKVTDPQMYMATAHTPARKAGEQVLTVAELPLEFLMNALRLVEGVPAQCLTERTGLPVTVLEPTISPLRDRGLLNTDPARLQATSQGLDFLNTILLAFTPQPLIG